MLYPDLKVHVRREGGGKWGQKPPDPTHRSTTTYTLLSLPANNKEQNLCMFCTEKSDLHWVILFSNNNICLDFKVLDNSSVLGLLKCCHKKETRNDLQWISTDHIQLLFSRNYLTWLQVNMCMLVQCNISTWRALFKKIVQWNLNIMKGQGNDKLCLLYKKVSICWGTRARHIQDSTLTAACLPGTTKHFRQLKFLWNKVVG